MSKIKTILRNSKVIILLACLLLGLFAISPSPWHDGASIKFVAKNSSAEHAGMATPKNTLAPVNRELIHYINNKEVKTVADYYRLTEDLAPNQTVSIKTSKGSYTLLARPLTTTITLNETEKITINETRLVNETINGTNVTLNKTFPKTITQNKTRTEVIGVEPLGLSVDEAATSNLRKGLDLQGGARVVLRPEAGATQDQVQDTIDSLQQRLNVYGLSDIVITQVNDNPLGGGNTFIVIEIAGANEQDVLPLLNGTGKFEAQITNKTVFSGGKDITYVCRTAQCSGIDPRRGCQQAADGWNCAFMFSITLSPEAAQRQADATGALSVTGDTLSDPIILYLDGKEVDRLNIAADLRGRASTDIAITGGGQGPTQQAAMQTALDNMKSLQTILKSGALPVKIEVERVDTISAVLGTEFLTNAFFVGLLALAGVAIVLTIYYRRPIIILPIMFTALSEVFLTLAISSFLFKMNIDLSAIAGLIISVGTGVNDQIIMTDEAIRKEDGSDGGGWKNRLKKAFFIIFSSALATTVAMLPLLFAGAGLLKGFAITSMLAIAVGILITRPAYAEIVHLLVEE